MRNVYIVADNIYSPLGGNSMSNMSALKKGISGIRLHHSGLSASPFFAALFTPADKMFFDNETAFEHIIINSARDAIRNAGLDTGAKTTGFILSTTKGNISLIEDLPDEKIPEERVALNTSAELIAGSLGFNSYPLVVSHACISGLLAMIAGMRLIQSGIYENVVIAGGDLISPFIYSGFQSFQAISASPCKPFDALRDGISLGEAAATVILSATKNSNAIKLSGGSVSNDANHISGPSRTGEELWLAIRRAMAQAGAKPDEIDFISAHGTATLYSDEMEAKAFHLGSLEKVPLNSLKGYYGHTLGAAGILESVVTVQCMKENVLLPTLGFSTPGTEKPVNVIREMKEKILQKCLKTASGFGGCNAAVILEKV
jgi:3-oxoacyl-[acyl-carrier-protein] synthase I